jgi:hypothetical protein
MTATLIPIDGGYKRRVNRPPASAVAKASGEGSFLRAKEGGVREGGGRAGRIACKPFAFAGPAGRQSIAAGPNLRNLARSLGAELFRSGPCILIPVVRGRSDDLPKSSR